MQLISTAAFLQPNACITDELQKLAANYYNLQFTKPATRTKNNLQRSITCTPQPRLEVSRLFITDVNSPSDKYLKYAAFQCCLVPNWPICKTQVFDEINDLILSTVVTY